MIEQNEINNNENEACEATAEELNQTREQVEEQDDAVAKLKEELGQKDKKCSEYLDRLQRMAAEFDNFRKRTIKEREVNYNDAVADTLKHILPVLDNLERALATEGGDATALREGVELVLRQLKDGLGKAGLEEIASQGEQFDPLLHNAVMHIEDDSIDSNTIIEVFEKGYKIKDKVIRHSMVKVAN